MATGVNSRKGYLQRGNELGAAGQVREEPAINAAIRRLRDMDK
jgi:hypothetical protein